MATRILTVCRRSANCPKCGQEWKRHSTGSRILHDLGVNEAEDIKVIYSKHFCVKCHKHFSTPAPGAAAGSHYMNRVKDLATSLVRKNGMTYTVACATLKNQYHVNVRPTTLHDWIAADLQLEDTDAQETPTAADPGSGAGPEDGPTPPQPQAPSGG